MRSNMASGVERALELLRRLPRVAVHNIKDLPESKIKIKSRRNLQRGRKCGRGDKGQGARGTLNRLGFTGSDTPFYLKIPKEPYYQGHHIRKQYPPLSLLQLQRMIDTGRVNPEEPIDLTSICNTKLYSMQPDRNHYGVHLTDEGVDIFTSQINIEVQWASELAISAIERNGGVITTRYYDLMSLYPMINPKQFFRKGEPIPKCALPPQDLLEYYSSPYNRGYLADPDKVAEARLELAQKYGYELPDLTQDPKYELLKTKKDPRQLFYGLSPGWIVCIKDKVVLKPKNKEYLEYYQS